MFNWIKIVPEVIKFAPRLAKKLLTGGRKADKAGKKIAGILGVDPTPELVLEVLKASGINTDKPLQILEGLENFGIDLEYLKSKKTVIGLYYVTLIMIGIIINPQGMLLNTTIITGLTGIVFVLVSVQGAIDHKKAGK